MQLLGPKSLLMPLQCYDDETSYLSLLDETN